MSDKTEFNPSNTLKGKRVLIVGGTSGIGLAAAIEAKGAGARVTVLGSDHERSRTIAAKH
ncbi:short-chain dehydrogenase, partial [Mesorhizobium sp. M1A.T.Ca.IN.004.03.1.1]